MNRFVTIANGAGFLGDQLAAPRRTVEAAAVDYLTLEYLAELTLSILARQREKDPSAGYAADFLTVLDSLRPALAAQPNWKIVTNAGGMNPESCARAAGRVLADSPGLAKPESALDKAPIGVVSGDDLVPRLGELQAAGCQFEHLDTGAPLASLGREVVAANAYLGAQPIAQALADGARILITGRVTDASLTVGPAVRELGWAWNDWPKLAAASVAGHLIECGAQVTGGLSGDWAALNLTDVGYPLAEISADAQVVITKPRGTGGAVTRATVVEQLVYEIGDPRCYRTPDVNVDFTALSVTESGPDRVTVDGAAGAPPSDHYKVSLAYRDGYMASGQLLVWGRDCVAKARACGQMVLDRVAAAGYRLARTHIECLGAGEGVPGAAVLPNDLREVMLRVTVHDDDRAAVERFTRELAPLVTSGPPGVAGYASGRSAVRPVLAYWPALVPKQMVEARVEVRPARDWA